ncbi:uncharacterized protein BDR25DRAFT_304534 [Lindgomyces ingoldianus]|uniref:Uncharacterized protein n=1 Tax=Lindgomyces ingoldianus TaxID=673940 RepID=A0ACB6QTP6_9PLEO|nr:uncharacterized protein BDR25DRAFT_304534 [Lindgomyces ingoldianus]KAF2469462.1 hypothetical protein BDR25DRAFT_304534 [Lindgomyces ingoldianus]
MAPANAPVWTWSETYKKYYYVTYDSNSSPVYHWSEQGGESLPSQQTVAQAVSLTSDQQTRGKRADSGSGSSPQSQYLQPNSPPNSCQNSATQDTFTHYSSPGSQQNSLSYHGNATQGNLAQYPSAIYHTNPIQHQGGSTYFQPATSSYGNSGAYQNFDYTPSRNEPDMPDPVPQETRLAVPGLIAGTPQRGWYEPLDSSYRMRTGAEARQFFKRGKVFSMLHSEPAGTPGRNGDDNFSVVAYGEQVYSQIRRFVIVKVNRGFVYACPISTYSGRGTTKPGCNPAEHAIIYFQGSSPQYVQGEYGNGMVKEPIEVTPATSGLTMAPASRLRFGKIYPVEWNVKVKDIGDVVPEDLSKLLNYYQEENEE